MRHLVVLAIVLVLAVPVIASVPTLSHGVRAFHDFGDAHIWEQGNGDIDHFLAVLKQAGLVVWLPAGTPYQIVDHHAQIENCLSCVPWTRIKIHDGTKWWIEDVELKPGI